MPYINCIKTNKKKTSSTLQKIVFLLVICFIRIILYLPDLRNSKPPGYSITKLHLPNQSEICGRFESTSTSLVLLFPRLFPSPDDLLSIPKAQPWLPYGLRHLKNVVLTRVAENKVRLLRALHKNLLQPISF